MRVAAANSLLDLYYELQIPTEHSATKWQANCEGMESQGERTFRIAPSKTNHHRGRASHVGYQRSNVTMRRRHVQNARLEVSQIKWV